MKTVVMMTMKTAMMMTMKKKMTPQDQVQEKSLMKHSRSILIGHIQSGRTRH